MILVDVYVPSVDRTYNFSLDEGVPVSSIVEELVEMVERKEQATFVGSREAVCLIDRGSERVLPRGNTLEECGIPTGSTLILI